MRCSVQLSDWNMGDKLHPQYFPPLSALPKIPLLGIGKFQDSWHPG